MLIMTSLQRKEKVSPWWTQSRDMPRHEGTWKQVTVGVWPRHMLAMWLFMTEQMRAITSVEFNQHSPVSPTLTPQISSKVWMRHTEAERQTESQLCQKNDRTLSWLAFKVIGLLESACYLWKWSLTCSFCATVLITGRYQFLSALSVWFTSDFYLLHFCAGVTRQPQWADPRRSVDQPAVDDCISWNEVI